ncbi:hypothetical protein D1007_48327 [Hordeum vulgare]|nr:hypothetical protein D1007_48327 [Hordeum vulgare]
MPLAYRPVIAPKRSASSTMVGMGNKPKKATKAKVNEDLARIRRQSVVFRRCSLPPHELIARYPPMWERERKLHQDPMMLQWDLRASPEKYPFFVVYFYYGLIPPFSALLIDLMLTYMFHLLCFTTNAVTTMCVFAHLCENFTGIAPNVSLFRHFFFPRREAEDAISGRIAWIPFVCSKEVYPPAFSTRSGRNGEDTWSAVAKDEAKLEIEITRLLWLKVAELTIEMDYAGPARIIQICPVLVDDFTSMELTFFRHQRFRQEGKFTLLPSITPLCNNSRWDAIVARMSSCNAHEVDPSWEAPPKEEVHEWFDTLAEVWTRDKGQMIRATPPAEVAYIGLRVMDGVWTLGQGDLGIECGQNGWPGIRCRSYCKRLA